MKDSVLEKILDFDRERDLPLHAQVRRVLARVAADHFEGGERFFSEPILIERLKVSQGTVRRALADLVQEGVLIREPAKGTYVRERKAQVRKLGVFIPLHESPLLASYLDRLSLGARQKGRRMEVYSFRADDGGKGPLEYVNWGPTEGDILLVCCPAMITWQFRDILSEAGYRVLCVDSTFGPRMDCQGVAVDNAAGIELGLSHLIELGHRRIAFLVNEPLELLSIPARRDAFQRLAPAMGVEYAPIIDCGTKFWESSFEKAYEELQKHGLPGDGVTAVFAASDFGAWAMLRYCAEKKIDVPGQLSVLGFDNVKASAMVCPPLSAIDYPFDGIVGSALQMLESEPTQEYRLIRPSLTQRASVGPARG